MRITKYLTMHNKSIEAVITIMSRIQRGSGVNYYHTAHQFIHLNMMTLCYSSSCKVLVFFLSHALCITHMAHGKGTIFLAGNPVPVENVIHGDAYEGYAYIQCQTQVSLAAEYHHSLRMPNYCV